MLLLSGIALWSDAQATKGNKLTTHPVVYSLSLAVYCTAWTYYGSVGRAATSGFDFLAIYIGPAIFAPIWMIVLRKIIYISKAQRITSVADFISSRYGKSTTLGIIAALIAVISIIPYISIQLKAIAVGFDILIQSSHLEATTIPFYLDAAFYIAVVLTIFTIWFGTSKLDPNESHEGLVAAIAFESVVKLIAFLSVGLFVTYSVFNGFTDLFKQASAVDKIQQLFIIKSSTSGTWEWIWMTIISMSAIILLPRQFHMAVVENDNPNAVRTASWLFPLYLLLINIFVIPIAIGGLLILKDTGIESDTYVLSLPLSFGKDYLALFVAIGGFSAATSMVIVAVIALSIMISNNIMVPLLLSSYTMRSEKVVNLSNRLLGIRRLSIVVVLLLAYGFFRAVSLQYALVSIGLISFTGIAQFMPIVIGGLYWKRATKAGAITGLCIGILVWAFTLPLPTLVESGNISGSLMSEGLWGISWLRPYALFGLEGMGQIAHAAFWSLLFNTSSYMVVSLITRPSAIELTQADFFVDIYKYKDKTIEYEFFKRRAKVTDLVGLLNRFLGEKRAKELLEQFEIDHQIKLSKIQSASTEFINFTETHLAGAIGAASAKAIVSSTSKQDPIKMEEVFTILDQTQEVIRYSKAMERKSKELEDLTSQLTEANKQLKELDRMKADFITTVTHEIRTPLTSIKALSKILYDYPQLELSKRQEYLDIISSESERLSRLINQVLDLEKIQSIPDVKMELIDFKEVVTETYRKFRQMMIEKNIDFTLNLPEQSLNIKGNKDRLTQVVVNLLSNAIKFCDSEQGKIQLTLKAQQDYFTLKIKDNGRGVPKAMERYIFERFTQVSHQQEGKPKGSGLGLAITKSIVEQHEGRIYLEDNHSQGATFVVQLPMYVMIDILDKS